MDVGDFERSNAKRHERLPVAFRPFAIDGSPASGELWICTSAERKRDSREISEYAYKEIGPSGERLPRKLLRGDGAIERIVVWSDPTLDDMLAALLCQMSLADQHPPEGLGAFTKYAKLARQGIQPAPNIPLEESLEGLFLAIRIEAGDDLSEPLAAQRFLDRWQELSDRIIPAAAEGIDPFTSNFLKGAPEFVAERATLAADQKVFRHDVQRGQRWVGQLPGGADRESILVLRQPKSRLFKYWARSDSQAPAGDRYTLLAVEHRPGDWVMSTDPLLQLSLLPLAERLSQLERAHRGKVGAGEPWFDGAPFQHTLIASPKPSTRLSEPQVLKELRSWTKAERGGAMNRRHWIAAAAASIAGAGALAGLSRFLPIGESKAQMQKLASGPIAAKPVPIAEHTIVAATLNGDDIERGLGAQPDAEGLISRKYELTVRRGENRLCIRELNHFTQPRPVTVSFRIDVPKAPNQQVEWSVELPRDRATGRLRKIEQLHSGRFSTGNIPTQLPGGEENEILFDFSMPKGDEELSGTIEVLVQPDVSKGIALHQLVIGVNDYDEQSHHKDLQCAVKDAVCFHEVISRPPPGGLFEVYPDPPLLDRDVTRKSVLQRLDAILDRKPKEHELVILYLSGHGIRSHLGEFFFLPSNYNGDEPLEETALSWTSIYRRLNALSCPCVVFLDACASGAVNDDDILRGDAKPNPRVIEDVQQSIQNATLSYQQQSKRGVIVVAACRGDESAIEAGPKGNGAAGQGGGADKFGGHGAFTAALLECLTGEKIGQAEFQLSPNRDAQKRGFLTVQDVQQYVSQRVLQMTGRQNPDQGKYGALKPHMVPIALCPSR